MNTVHVHLVWIQHTIHGAMTSDQTLCINSISLHSTTTTITHKQPHQ